MGQVVKEEMFKDIFFYLWQLFCAGKCSHWCNFGRGYYEKHFCEIVLNLENISYLQLWQLNYLYKFGKGHNGEHLCGTHLNLDQWFSCRCLLKKKFT